MCPICGEEMEEQWDDSILADSDRFEPRTIFQEYMDAPSRLNRKIIDHLVHHIRELVQSSDPKVNE